MTTSMNALLSRVGQETQPDWVEDVADVASDPASLTCAATLKTSGTQGSLWTDGYAVLTARTSPNRIRDVAGVDPTTGKATLGSAVNSAVSGDGFQLWSRWHPRRVQEQAARAQAEMWAVFALTLTGANLGDQQRQVGLTALYPWLTSPGQVVDLLYQSDPAGQYKRREVRGWRAWADADTNGAPIVTLDLSLETFASTDTLILKAWRTLDSISPLGETTASVAPLEWLAWETIWRMARLPDYEDKDLQARAVAELDDLRGVDAGPQSYRLFEDNSVPWGPRGWGR